MVEFRKTATLSDFEVADSQAMIGGKYQEVMTMKVPAQQNRFFGNGAIINGVDDRGEFKLDLQETGPANIPGTSRLVVADANKVVRNFRREDRSEDATSGINLGKDSVFAKEDSYLIVEYNPDADKTMQKSLSSAKVPITIRTL
jgi:hypothetical protein